MKIESSILIPTLAEISIGPSITRSFMDKKPDSFNNLIVSSGKLGNKSKEKGLLFDLVLKNGLLESGLKFKYTISYPFQYFNNANNSD
jgi:hypothetical protein